MTAPVPEPTTRSQHAWRITDVVRLYALNLAAAAALLTAWWWAAGTVRTSAQIVCVAVGVAAVVVVGTGNCLWLLAGRHAIATRRRAVNDRGELLAEALARATTRSGGPSQAAFLALAGSQLYHRSSCPLVAGKPGAQALRVAGVNGRRPCGVCAP